MSYTPNYIASFDQDSGLNTYYEPFLIPEKAFPKLEDCYCFRGKVKRRPGLTLLGRLRRIFTSFKITDTDSTTTSINLFTKLGITGQPNAQIEPKTLVITIAAPIGQILTDSTGDGSLTIAPAGVITAANINYNTGILTLTFSGVVAASVTTVSVAYYPGLPVMGIRTEELPLINDENSIIFDTKYAYQYNPTTTKFEELPATTPTTWTATNSDFFWTTNYWSNTNGPIFWATNSTTIPTSDHIRYYDTVDWVNFEPQVRPGVFLEQAQIILPYKDRLLFINTWEGANIAATTHFPQRVRWSWPANPLDVTAFLDDVPGKGGYVDATTNEQIVGAEFIKDTLIIKFERSSWKLIYTANEVFPFMFQKINTELGAESKFSLIPFDRGVFSVGNYGITTDDSVNVERIDIQIPNVVFNFSNGSQGVQRVYGIRDFTRELVFWAFPTPDIEVVYPNKVLVYNYRNQTYAIFNDSFTCYGYIQLSNSIAWAQLTYPHWSDWLDSWSSGGLQGKYPWIAVGNQHGFVSYIDDTVTNDFSLYIKSINFALSPPQFTIPNHNLETDDVIIIDKLVGGGTVNPSLLNGHTFLVSKVDGNIITVKGFSNGTFQDIIALGWCAAGSTYLGAGEVLKINGINISTKVFAPFYDQASQCRLGYIDYLIDRTVNGQIVGNVFINEDSSTSMTDSIVNTSLLGSSVIYTKPENLSLISEQASQKKIWHRQFIHMIAQNFQVVLSMTPEQLAQKTISDADFVLHAMVLYVSPNARLVQ